MGGSGSTIVPQKHQAIVLNKVCGPKPAGHPGVQWMHECLKRQCYRSHVPTEAHN